MTDKYIHYNDTPFSHFKKIKEPQDAPIIEEEKNQNRSKHTETV